MARELALVALMMCSGCSLILDFGTSAVPIDAMIDAPYTQPQCDYMEPNGTFAQAATIVPGTDTGPAAICADAAEDDAFYKFTVPTNTKVTVSLAFTARVGGDLDLRLYDSTMTMVGQSREIGPETLVCPAVSPLCPHLAPGDYVFEVFPGAPGQVNAYTFCVAIQ